MATKLKHKRTQTRTPVPVEIADAEDELVIERVAAIDVTKAGDRCMCVRACPVSPGAGSAGSLQPADLTRAWDVTEMYWNGAHVEEIYPVSAVYDGQAVNVTTCSYADRIGFG